MRWSIPALLCFLLVSCDTADKMADKNAVRLEIVGMETEFAAFLKDSGVAPAFYKFAAEDAVILRDDSVIKGRDGIRNYYSRAVYEKAWATWSPDFVDVSEDGRMAYTYGKYNWTFTDSSGKETKYNGTFHTVWKKMDDGTWKYVWD